jgi:hypothetical protein
MSKIDHPDDGHYLRLAHDRPEGPDMAPGLRFCASCGWLHDRHAPPMMQSGPQEEHGPSPALFCVIAGGMAGLAAGILGIVLGLSVWMSLLVWTGVGLGFSFCALAAIVIATPSKPRLGQLTFADGETKSVGVQWLDGAIARPLGSVGALRGQKDKSPNCPLCGPVSS